MASPTPAQPFPKEFKKASRILKEVTLSRAEYAAYLRKASRWTARPEALASSPIDEDSIFGFELRNSILFRREFLVAYSDTLRFQAKFPSTDAVAVLNMRRAGNSPPQFVLLPESKKNASGRFFESLLEHEFVHVNQGIRKASPTSARGTVKDLLAHLFAVTRAEYEANLIQLTRWPDYYLQTVSSEIRERFGLDGWCALRGYTQGLEEIMDAAGAGFIPEGEVLSFVKQLPGALPAGIAALGVSKAVGKDFAQNLQGHLLAARQRLAHRGNHRMPQNLARRRQPS